MNLKTKRSKSLTVAALTAAMLLPLGSCSHDSEVDKSLQGGDPVEAKFSARIAAPVTRASGTMWDNEDRIGIFMLNAGGSLAVATDVLADNYQYVVDLTSAGGNPVADAADYLKPVAGTVYMQPGVNYDFVAYYPFKGSLADGCKYPVNLAGQTEGSAAHDLLYATSSRSNVKSDMVSFEFSHVLSKIAINVTRGKGVNAVAYAGKDAMITGMPTTGEFNLSDATLSGLDDVADITSSGSDDDGNVYEVIILPQTAGTYPGRTISFVVDGQEYYWAIPNGFAFESGKRYTYTFKLTTGGLELNGDVEIDEWIDGGELGEDTWGSGVDELAMIETVDIATTTFSMGSGVSTNSTIHQVSFTAAGFKMSKYQITTTQYCDYLNGDKDNIEVKQNGAEREAWGTLPALGIYNDALMLAADVVAGKVLLVRSHTWGIMYDGTKWVPQDGFEEHPANQVTWYGAMAFCLYNDCRLPTEAEWEYASKAGSTQTAETTNYGLGVTSDEDPTPVQITASNLVNYAWFTTNNTPAGTKAVGGKLPNVWGLYDMHGNVWEWCYDWYGSTFYGSAAVTDPVNHGSPSGTPGSRVLRGGYYNDTATYCRSAFRYGISPAHVHYGCGFRVVFPL